MKRIIDIAFWLTLGAFLLLGAVIVLVQLIGVVTLNGDLMVWAAETLNWPAFTSATLCAVAAFVRTYFADEPAVS
ncbi:hypothetical protein [Micrococcus luteus]|uniref:hypothetical protein n=1 Tax=Micrococcus luteus TaxID=1270 RepID=UPI00119F7C98|nr:hypothetical protein [Micrococcus luteus]